MVVVVVKSAELDVVNPAAAAAAFNRELWALIAVSVAYCISRADTVDLDDDHGMSIQS